MRNYVSAASQRDNARNCDDTAAFNERSKGESLILDELKGSDILLQLTFTRRIVRLTVLTALLSSGQQTIKLKRASDIAMSRSVLFFIFIAPLLYINSCYYAMCIAARAS